MTVWICPALLAKPAPGVRGVVAFAGEARIGGLGVVPQKIQNYGEGCPKGNRPWVGEEGFEPSHPLGHTDLNRARLPFRHSPSGMTTQASTTPSVVAPRITSDG